MPRAGILALQQAQRDLTPPSSPEPESLLRVIRQASSGLGLDRVSPVTDTSLEQTWRDHRREWIAATAAQK